jgi:hypothetical protein
VTAITAECDEKGFPTFDLVDGESGFNVWSEYKLVEKLRYIHRNPVSRWLVALPEVCGVVSVIYSSGEASQTARPWERIGI